MSNRVVNNHFRYHISDIKNDRHASKFGNISLASFDKPKTKTQQLLFVLSTLNSQLIDFVSNKIQQRNIEAG